jgi:hypothetical protein
MIQQTMFDEAMALGEPEPVKVGAFEVQPGPVFDSMRCAKVWVDSLEFFTEAPLTHYYPRAEGVPLGAFEKFDMAVRFAYGQLAFEWRLDETGAAWIDVTRAMWSIPRDAPRMTPLVSDGQLVVDLLSGHFSKLGRIRCCWTPQTCAQGANLTVKFYCEPTPVHEPCKSCREHPSGHGTCGAYAARWHCCGLVAVAPEPTTTYRAGAVCPRCGVGRYPTPAPYRPIDGAETVRSRGLNTEKDE